VKHSPILVVFGKQNYKTSLHKRLQFWPLHPNSVATLPCEM